MTAPRARKTKTGPSPMTPIQAIYIAAAWPEVADRLREVLDAFAAKDARREADAWRAIVDGAPLFSWVAVLGAYRPAVAEAIAAGFALSGEDVQKAIEDIANDLKEDPSVADEPMLRVFTFSSTADVYAFARCPVITMPGGVPLSVDQWKLLDHVPGTRAAGIDVVLSPALTPAQQVAALDVIGDLFVAAGGRGGLAIRDAGLSTDDRMATVCPNHAPSSYAECGCPDMADVMGIGRAEVDAIFGADPEPPPVPCPHWEDRPGVTRAALEERREGHPPTRDDPDARWCLLARGHDSPCIFVPEGETA